MARRRIAARSMMALLAGVCLVAVLSTTPTVAATGDNSESGRYLQDAQRYLRKGDVNAAVIQLKNALQADPGNVTARKTLGSVYLRLGNGAAAEKEFKEAARRAPNDAELKPLIGQAYLLEGKYDDVLKEIKDDVSDPKIRLDILLVRGRAELGLRKLKEADDTLLAAEKLAPKDPRPKIGIAQTLAAEGKAKESEAKIDEALAIAPNNSEALMLKGELLRAKHDLTGAVAEFDHSLKSNPNNLAARLGRAATLIDLNKDDQAQLELQSIFARAPKQPLASYLSALLRAKKKDFAGAQEVLQEAGPALDNYPPSIFLNGALCYALGQLEQADQYLTHYLQLVPNNERARKLLGATLLRKNSAQRAVDVLQPIANAKVKDPQALALLGDAYIRLGKYAKGSEYFEQAAALAPKAANFRTELAVSRLAQGNSSAAINDLEKAMDLNGDSSQAGFLLTLIRLRKGDFKDAAATAEKLQKAQPKNPLPYNLLGAALLGQGKVDEAKKSFEEALKIKPDFQPARMNLAQLALRQNKLDVAKSEYETVLKQDPTHLGAMMQLAEIAAKERKPADVLAWLQKASQANPKSPAPKLRLIRYYEQMRDVPKALAVARELETTVHDNPQVLEARGRVEAEAGHEDASADAYHRLVDLAPNSARAHGLYAASLARTNDIDGAKANYEKALKLDSNYTPAYLALAEIAAKAGKIDEALKYAATLKEKQPKAAVGDMLAGDIYMRTKKYDKAIAAYDAGLKKEDVGELAIRRFSAERAAGHTEAAFKWLQAWVDRTNQPVVRNVLASNYIAAKKYNDAIREFEKLIKVEPRNPVVLNNLAWLYDQKGDKRAIEYAEKAYKEAPKAPAIMDTLGWILVRKGDKNRGLDLLREAHNLVPNQGDITYHLVVAMRATGSGSREEAKRLLERALKGDPKFSEVNNARKLLKELGG